MKQILFGFVRGMLALGGAFWASTAVNLVNHQGYWEGTIKRVQTTDFNILAHTLPTKLSYALLQNNSSEIQRTLNSNYGLFGLVVTNCTTVDQECPNQEILYITESDKSWRKQLTPTTLKQHPFSFLRNPPPVFAETSYTDSRATRWEETVNKNTGNIIGRVYYIRGIPPEFFEAHNQWLTQLPESLLSDKSASRYYALTFSTFMLFGLLTWGTIEWFLQGRRAKQQQFQRSMNNVELQLAQTRRSLKNQLKQIEGRIKYIQQLENYQQEQNKYISQLNQTITRLESQLNSPKKSLSPANLEQSQSQLKAKIQQQLAAITTLNQQIANQKAGASQNQQLVNQLNQELAVLTTQLSGSQKAMVALHQQIADQDAKQQELQRLVEQWRRDVQVAQQREVQAQRQQQEMQSSLDDLKQQKESLQRQIEKIENPELNKFEKLIVTCLERTRYASSGTWLIRPSKDVKREGEIRQFADCLIFARSCVVVIEAKNFKGQIKSVGEAQATTWFQLQGDRRTKISSCHGCNPYEQVNQYADSVMKRLGSAISQRRVRVYSLIVFPDNADLKAIKPEIDNPYSQVICLKDMIPALKQLEQKAMNGCRTASMPLSAQQIENTMFRLDT